MGLFAPAICKCRRVTPPKPTPPSIATALFTAGPDATAAKDLDTAGASATPLFWGGAYRLPANESTSVATCLWVYCSECTGLESGFIRYSLKQLKAKEGANSQLCGRSLFSKIPTINVSFGKSDLPNKPGFAPSVALSLKQSTLHQRPWH